MKVYIKLKPCKPYNHNWGEYHEESWKTNKLISRCNRCGVIRTKRKPEGEES